MKEVDTARGRHATVAAGPGGRYVVLKPAPGASLRSIEVALAEGGVLSRATKRLGSLYVPKSDLGPALNALGEWDLEVDPEVEAWVQESRDRSASNRRGKEAVARLSGAGIASASLADFPEASLLDPHQVQAVAIASDPDVAGLCLFDEQGLGKTVMALFAFHRLRGSGAVGRALVVSPKSMVLEWVRDAERLLPGRYRVVPVIGTVTERRAALDQQADIYVTNFETAVRLEARVSDLLAADRGRAVLVVDESFFVKNETARRTRAVKALRRHAGRCWVLCGTPAPNAPQDLVAQVGIADGGSAFGGVEVPLDREAARDVVSGVLQERAVYLRRLKQDALPNLPGRAFHRVTVPLEPVQKHAYGAALHSLIRDLRAVDDVGFRRRIRSFAARRMALLQLCSNPSAVLSQYEETPAKLLALDAILADLVERRHEKVVVWSFFVAAIDAICQRYGRYGLVRYDGGVQDPLLRREAVRRFQEDDETMLFVANPAAAGAGLTLHRARYAVYESMSNQAAHYLQSLDRLHRRGQTRSVEYTVLLCDGTVEIQEYERLIRKERAAQQLLGDDVEAPPTRTTMLEGLLASARLMEADRVDVDAR